MPSANRPTVRMRRIGSALRKAREERGMTLDTACRRYGRSKGWLSTLENGLHPVDPQELADLLDFYGVPDGPLRDSLLHLATHVRDRNWQRAREGRISAAALDLASLEEDAEVIRTFEPCLVPGLLQIPEYAHALMVVGSGGSPNRLQALVKFRIDRQRVLRRPDPPSYVAILSEAALRNEIGGPTAMRAQLKALIETAAMRSVTVRVLPRPASAHLCLAGPFHLVTLRPPGTLTVTVVEQFARSLFVEDDEKVASHQKVFDRLLGASLDENSSLDLIEGLASRV